MDENPYKAPQTDCSLRTHRSPQPLKFDKLGFLAHLFFMASAALVNISIEAAISCFVATLICIGLGKRK
jgi:hypothetical protein